jgi:rubredoxin
MVCIDCGYVYRGDFSALPNSYRCPTCGVGKNRFKPAMTPSFGVAAPKKQAPNFNTPGVLAQKRKNKEAFRKRRAANKKSPRELAKEKMLEEQAKKDANRGGGFFGR